MGIEVYATHSHGIGGVIKQSVEDFLVEEVLVDGSKAEIRPSKALAGQAVLGSSWAKNRYLLCVLVKRDWDTFLAVKSIAKQLGIRASQVQFAGIKDAKAVTAQHIALESVAAEEIGEVQVRDIEIRPIGYTHSKLSSYYLLGNSFRITIRAINHSESTIKKRVTKTLQELEAVGGIPNFFGHQRFGTTRPITHLVGKAMVQGNLRKAAMLFLAKPSAHEHPESSAARKRLQATQDFSIALKTFPRKLHYERLMLRRLASKPDDYGGAFRRLPIKLLELFPQAYQAYLFNKFLSKRIEEEFPLNHAVLGDYVVSVERSGLPMLTMHQKASEHNLGEINKRLNARRMRVAIPLVGYKQSTSQGAEREIERRILEEEAISPEDFRIKAMPEISPRGGLRTAITSLNSFSSVDVSEDVGTPSKRVASVGFMLYRGSYATVFLRELMKPRDPIESGF